MARMGHDSMRAALIYQHATTQADQAIARWLDAELQRRRDASDSDDNGPDYDDDDGTAGVLARRSNSTRTVRADISTGPGASAEHHGWRLSPCPVWGFSLRAGDENRTRTVSLGS